MLNKNTAKMNTFKKCFLLKQKFILLHLWLQMQKTVMKHKRNKKSKSKVSDNLNNSYNTKSNNYLLFTGTHIFLSIGLDHFAPPYGANSNCNSKTSYTYLKRLRTSNDRICSNNPSILRCSHKQKHHLIACACLVST